MSNRRKIFSNDLYERYNLWDGAGIDLKMILNIMRQIYCNIGRGLYIIHYVPRTNWSLLLFVYCVCKVETSRISARACVEERAARGRHSTHFRRYDGANSAIGHVVRQAVSCRNWWRRRARSCSVISQCKRAALSLTPEIRSLLRTAHARQRIVAQRSVFPDADKWTVFYISHSIHTQ